MAESYNDSLHKHAIPQMYEYAKALRSSQTEAEELLWQRIRGRKLNGLKFRRQHPLHNFIADFYCNEKKLVVEIDGGIHDNAEAKLDDENRTTILNELGITVMRFSNDEVKTKIEEVLNEIKAKAQVL